MVGRAGLGSRHAPASQVSRKVERVCPPVLLPSSLCLDRDCLVLGPRRAGPAAASHPLWVQGRARAWSCARCLGVPCPPLPPPLPGRCQGRRARSSSPDPSHLLPGTRLKAALCLAPSPSPRMLPHARGRPPPPSLRALLALDWAELGAEPWTKGSFPVGASPGLPGLP